METNIIATVLFSLELYHVITHCLILFRVRMLPRKDLAKARYYFLVDTFTVFATCFLFTGALRWLATLQIIQHLFYFCFWENNEHVKKVVSWSSLDWTRSFKGKHYEWVIILGTSFDVLVHVIDACLLVHYMTYVNILIATIVTQVLLKIIIFNDRFAWSSPFNTPQWVERRLKSMD